MEPMEPRLLMCGDPLHQTSHAAATAAAAARQAVVSSLTTAGFSLRVDAAGSSAYTDASGAVWAKDAGFIGGAANTQVFAVSGTTDDTLYATRRTGQSFAYASQVPNGN